MKKAKRHIKRLTIGIVGSIVTIVGIIAVPFPGPGWLIVFAGLAILSTEFEWAQRILDYAKLQYDKWRIWLKKQNIIVQILVLLFTFILVIIITYLANVYAMINRLFGLNIEWLQSPFFNN